MKKEIPTTVSIKSLSFYKEENIWYADLPEFVELGLGTKANLMMVDGADTFLDFLTSNGNDITLKIGIESFEGQEAVLIKEGIGLNAKLLAQVGHAPVTYGAYYNISAFKNQPFQHRLWLCPVTEHVFGGGYPDKIYMSA